MILAEVGRWRLPDIKLIMRDINPAADARAFLGTTLRLGGTYNFNQRSSVSPPGEVTVSANPKGAMH